MPGAVKLVTQNRHYSRKTRWGRKQERALKLAKDKAEKEAAKAAAAEAKVASAAAKNAEAGLPAALAALGAGDDIDAGKYFQNRCEVVKHFATGTVASGSNLCGPTLSDSSRHVCGDSSFECCYSLLRFSFLIATRCVSSPPQNIAGRV